MRRPRESQAVLAGIAALFSLLHIVYGVYSLNVVVHPAPVILALALYAAVTALSLAPFGRRRMPIWMAALNCAAVVAICLLVSAQLDAQRAGGHGFATWFVPAVGTILTITATRGRYGIAWIGTGFLVVHSIAWAGFPAIFTIGVVGSVAWVAVAHALGLGMAAASRDSRQFALAEREAADWQALQEAHVHERQFRLGQTNSMALAMLRVIEESGGNLSEAQKRECLLLERAIRDEIRGRGLLNDAVRHAVMAARRRGVDVSLLDEGGLDELTQAKLDRVLDRVADAVNSCHADTVVVRTVHEGPVAVTVVGLRHRDGGATGSASKDSADDEIDLWLEIPRP